MSEINRELITKSYEEILLNKISNLLKENAELKKNVAKLNNYGSAEIRRLTKERDDARNEAALLSMQCPNYHRRNTAMTRSAIVWIGHLISASVPRSRPNVSLAVGRSTS